MALARGAAPLMEKSGGSSIGMSYYGAEKVVAGYNVMGVAKASLEASMRYLAYDLGPQRHPRQLHQRRAGEHAGRARHPRLHRHAQAPRGEGAAPAQRRAARGLGDTGLFLASTMSSGITGEVIHVDCGYFVMGV